MGTLFTTAESKAEFERLEIGRSLGNSRNKPGTTWSITPGNVCFQHFEALVQYAVKKGPDVYVIQRSFCGGDEGEQLDQPLPVKCDELTNETHRITSVYYLVMACSTFDDPESF